MRCSGCGVEKKLIKSHIIPESFFRKMKCGGETIYRVTNTFNNEWEHKKRTPIGVYDKTILCDECEKRFSNTDDYGYRMLFENKQNEIIIENQRFYVIKNIDYKLTKLFFISILWRASVSNDECFCRVKLGAIEQVAKKHIWEENPGSSDDFSFRLYKFIPTDTGYEKAMLMPERIRFGPVNYYKFYLAGYILCIKADNRETPDLYSLNHFKIEQNQKDMLVVALDFFEDPACKKMYDIANSSAKV